MPGAWRLKVNKMDTMPMPKPKKLKRKNVEPPQDKETLTKYSRPDVPATGPATPATGPPCVHCVHGRPHKDDIQNCLQSLSKGMMFLLLAILDKTNSDHVSNEVKKTISDKLLGCMRKISGVVSVNMMMLVRDACKLAFYSSVADANGSIDLLKYFVIDFTIALINSELRLAIIELNKLKTSSCVKHSVFKNRLDVKIKDIKKQINIMSAQRACYKPSVGRTAFINKCIKHLDTFNTNMNTIYAEAVSHATVAHATVAHATVAAATDVSASDDDTITAIVADVAAIPDATAAAIPAPTAAAAAIPAPAPAPTAAADAADAAAAATLMEIYNHL